MSAEVVRSLVSLQAFRACLKSIALPKFRSSPIFIALLPAASSTYHRGYASSVLSPVHINLDKAQNFGNAILFKQALRVLVLFVGLLGSRMSFASLYFEPSLGYTFGTFETNVESIGDYSIKGPALGVRLGATVVPMVFVAADVMYLSGDGSAEKSGQDDVEGKNTLAGLTVGVNLPVLLRFWVGYMFYNHLETKDSAGTDKYTGSAIKIGMGYQPAPLISINLEYLMESFDKYKAAGASEVDLPLDLTGGDKLDPKLNTLILSVGVPL